jgi:hypothetical protein
MANNDSFDDALVNDGCAAVGAAESICTGMADDDLDGYVNDGCAQDGARSEGEFNIGTNSLGPCSVGVDPGPSPSWPSDLVSGGAPLDSTDRINVLDITSYLVPRRLDTSPGDANYSERFDLAPGLTFPFTEWIAVNDLTTLLAGSQGFPPMFGAMKAFNGPLCTGP